MTAHRVRPGDEVEISFRLDYKSAEVGRLPDAAAYSHITVAVGDPARAPSDEVRRCFSPDRDTVRVTQDDPLIRFVTRVTAAMPDDILVLPVRAVFSDGTLPAAGEVPVVLAELELRRA